MQRAKNQVTGHGCANGNVRGFNVSNFTNHDHIRILSKDVTQTFGKGEVDLRLHVDLQNAGQSIFDRFFNRDDTPLHEINAAKKAIQ